MKFFVQFIDLLAVFFVVTFPYLLGHFVNLLQGFVSLRIFHLLLLS